MLSEVIVSEVLLDLGANKRKKLLFLSAAYLSLLAHDLL